MWCSLDLQLILSCSVSKQLAIRPGYCYELEDGTGSYKDFHSSRNNRFTFRKEADKIRIQHPSNILYFFNAPPDVTPEVFSKVRGLGRLAVCHFKRTRLTKTNPCRINTKILYLYKWRAIVSRSWQICEEIGVKCPVHVNIFTGKSKLILSTLFFSSLWFILLPLILRKKNERGCWFEMCWFFQLPGLSAPTDRKVAGLLEWDSISNTMDALAMMNHYQMKNESEWSTDFLKSFFFLMHIRN